MADTEMHLFSVKIKEIIEKWKMCLMGVHRVGLWLGVL